MIKPCQLQPIQKNKFKLEKIKQQPKLPKLIKLRLIQSREVSPCVILKNNDYHSLIFYNQASSQNASNNNFKLFYGVGYILDLKKHFNKVINVLKQLVHKERVSEKLEYIYENQSNKIRQLDFFNFAFKLGQALEQEIERIFDNYIMRSLDQENKIFNAMQFQSDIYLPLVNDYIKKSCNSYLNLNSKLRIRQEECRTIWMIDIPVRK
ncbi:unnamed protein product [Paramecium octaurelia]|uniref:Uncharacterized protein n=1 Tax=Paramecium octaurelia TaxID=43137 RepID=A0A8S1WL80_PAROT|nr:unnamed protein product [Paramecium octaurelia]